MNGNIQICLSCLRLVKFRLGLDQYFSSGRIPSSTSSSFDTCLCLALWRRRSHLMTAITTIIVIVYLAALTDDRLLRGAFISLMKRRPEGRAQPETRISSNCHFAHLPGCAVLGAYKIQSIHTHEDTNTHSISKHTLKLVHA